MFIKTLHQKKLKHLQNDLRHKAVSNNFTPWIFCLLLNLTFNEQKLETLFQNKSLF